MNKNKIPLNHINKLKNLGLEIPPYPTNTAADFEARGMAKGKIGIYFLWNEWKELIYVGRSLDIGNRILTHEKIRYDKDRNIYDSKKKYKVFVSYVEIDEKEINWIELLYIGILRPKLNGEAKNKRRKKL